MVRMKNYGLALGVGAGGVVVVQMGKNWRDERTDGKSFVRNELKEFGERVDVRDARRY